MNKYKSDVYLMILKFQIFFSKQDFYSIAPNSHTIFIGNNIHVSLYTRLLIGNTKNTKFMNGTRFVWLTLSSLVSLSTCMSCILEILECFSMGYNLRSVSCGRFSRLLFPNNIECLSLKNNHFRLKAA